MLPINVLLAKSAQEAEAWQGFWEVRRFEVTASDFKFAFYPTAVLWLGPTISSWYFHA